MDALCPSSGIETLVLFCVYQSKPCPTLKSECKTLSCIIATLGLLNRVLISDRFLIELLRTTEAALAQSDHVVMGNHNLPRLGRLFLVPGRERQTIRSRTAAG